MSTPGTPDAEALASIDRLIHEPARLIVLANLSVLERADATFLLRQTGLTWGNLASHLGKLEDAGYISVKKTFVDRRPKTLLKLTAAGRKAFDIYRRHMRQVLDDPAGA